MSDLDTSRAEDCRYEVRHYLAVRSTLAQDAATVHRQLARKFDFTRAEVTSALVFLVSLGQAEVSPASLGSTKFYQITAKGTLAEERGE